MTSVLSPTPSGPCREKSVADPDPYNFPIDKFAGSSYAKFIDPDPFLINSGYKIQSQFFTLIQGLPSLQNLKIFPLLLKMAKRNE